MSRQPYMCIVACGLLFASFGAVAASHAEEAPSDPALATLGGVPEQDRALVDEFSGRSDEEQRALRSDLGNLARAWGRAGGNDGFSFWERAYRRYQAADIEATALRDYTVSYRELLLRAPSALEEATVTTEVADAVRDRLLRAAELRTRAMAAYVAYLDGRRSVNEDPDPERLQQQLKQAETDLQASYRLTRQAMNTSQAALDAVEQARIPEGSFL